MKALFIGKETRRWTLTHAFCADVTCEKSFENIRQWIKNIETHASEDVEKMILGNKCDMEDKRAVAKEVCGVVVDCSLFDA